MSKLIFKLETLNPKFRTTFFKHKSYTKYLAYSEYAIRNKNTSHGLFGIINKFPNIENMETIEEVSKYITDLAENRVPIYRGLISLNEYDANRLGYFVQDKWKELLENKLPSIARTLNIKYEDIQYVGAVHLENGHPHLQFMLWSKSRDKSNYYVRAELKDKLRKEFTNVVFREDLLSIYKEKDLAKKNILAENEMLSRLKQVNKDDKFLKDIMHYEKNLYNSAIMKQTFKDEKLKKIVNMLLELKAELKNTSGSIKYQYLQKYPEIISKIDSISREIINTSKDCKIQIDNYINAKYKILEYQYSDETKLETQKQKIKEEVEQEVLKLVGNKVLDLERKLLNSKEINCTYSNINETRNCIFSIYDLLYVLSYREQNIYSRYKLNYKKQLSKQAKKEKAKEKRNSSSFNWEEEL